MIQPRRMGHVVLKVRDLERAEQFYTEVLGFRVSGRFPESMVFFSLGDSHHDLAVVRVDPEATTPKGRGYVGLFHAAYQLASLDDLHAAYRELRERGVPIVGTSDHRVSRSIYLNDPDGNQIELFADLPREEWEHIPNAVAHAEPYSFED